MASDATELKALLAAHAQDAPMMARHQAVVEQEPEEGTVLRPVNGGQVPGSAAAARAAPKWNGMKEGSLALAGLPRIAGNISVHAAHQDAARLWVVAADAKVDKFLIADAATAEEARSVEGCAGAEEEQAVTGALRALPLVRRAQWMGILRCMGYGLTVGPMLDDEGLPVDEQDVLGYSEHALRLPMDVLQAVSVALAEEQLPELAKVASPGCIAGPRMPKSCSPAMLAACTDSALLYAPMQGAQGGYREPPPKAAAAQVAFAAKQLQKSTTLGAVAVIIPHGRQSRGKATSTAGGQ